MTEGERVAATQDAVVELEEQRESRQTAKRESRVSTTRDIRSTLDAIEAEVCLTPNLCSHLFTDIWHSYKTCTLARAQRYFSSLFGQMLRTLPQNPASLRLLLASPTSSTRQRTAL